jgi:hypothetical protein
VRFKNKEGKVIEIFNWNVMQRKKSIDKNGNISNFGARLICMSCSD